MSPPLPLIGVGRAADRAGRRARARPTRSSCSTTASPRGVRHPPGRARLPGRSRADASAERRGFETRAIHAGQEPDPATGAVVVAGAPDDSTYEQDGVGGLRGGYEYAAVGNPTRDRARGRLAALEAGHGRAGLRLGPGRRGHPAAHGAAGPATTSSSRQRRVRRHVPADLEGARARGACECTPADLDDLDAVRAACGRRPGSSGARRRPTRCSTSPTSPPSAEVAHERRRAARRRQHVRLAVPPAAADARCRRGRPLDHEVPRRPLRRRRRRAGRRATPTLGERLGFHQNAMGAVAGPFDSLAGAARASRRSACAWTATATTPRAVVELLPGHPDGRRGALPRAARAPRATTSRPAQMSRLRRDGVVPAARRRGRARSSGLRARRRLFTLAESLGGSSR